MSEILKNIETCRGEDVLAEVSAAPQDPHFGSLVNEAFDPMQQQALHQAGYDGYSEVIAQHKPYTFASAIIQMKSNLLLLLRALWQFPFGSGTLRSLSDDASLRSLADMWQHYITRLSGNETYGIPSRLSSLTDLPSAPALVADRKISGVPEAADGMSLVNLLLSDTRSTVTEIEDTNEDWIMNKAIDSIISAFPNLTKVGLHPSFIDSIIANSCQNITEFDLRGVKKIKYNVFGYPFVGSYGGEVYSMPDLVEVLARTTSGNDNTRYYFSGCSMKRALFENLETFSDGDCRKLFTNCANLEEIYAPKLSSFTFAATANNGYYMFAGCPNIKKIVIGTLTHLAFPYKNNWSSDGLPNLVHLEIGADTAISLNFAYINPTNALDASLDTLVTDEDCHNNLEQFLKNFRTYIALRLTDNGSGKTLTLSQAVYDAIKDESHLFVFDEGTMTIYAYLTNIKHWTVTK